jgi:hypothetical protein
MVLKWLLFLQILSNALHPGTSREPMVRAFFHTLIVRAWVRRCAGLLTLVKNIQTFGRFFEPLHRTYIHSILLLFPSLVVRSGLVPK